MEGPLSQSYHGEEKAAVNPFCYVSKMYFLLDAAIEVCEFVCQSSEHESCVIFSSTHSLVDVQGSDSDILSKTYHS